VTVQYWVYFFLAVSVLSLFVDLLFTRQVIGADTGTAAMQQIAAAIKEGAKAFLKRGTGPRRPCLEWACCFPAFAYAQPEHAGGGGEANLVLPDLSSVIFSA
jgi:K(+)-stimulated pyrophosphate-energized sodium pump